MINVVWSETALSDDNRSHYGVATLVNLAMDHCELGCVHRNGFEQLPVDAKGAVVVIHGEHQVKQLQLLTDKLNRLEWSVVIIIGDDAAVFPTERLVGGRRKIWQQMPVPGRHDFATRRLVCGFPHDAPAYLAHCQGLPRRLVWSFAGQCNHAWRRECVAQLSNMNDGFLMQTSGFWQGLPRDEYYRILAESKFVACPSGACTPDTLRVFESLEAGSVPVADDRFPPGYPRGIKYAGEYWKYMLGDVPFPVLTSWSEFPRVIKEWSENYEERRERLQAWWKNYKNEMSRWLEEDVQSVQ
jgi:hypothetical protein